MPRIVNERTNKLNSTADFAALIETLDEANSVPVHAPDGTETRFQLIQNLGTGDYVASMGGDYEVVQSAVVAQGFLDAVIANDREIVGGYIKQTPNAFRAVVQFADEIFVGQDPSPYMLGAVVRNSYDGTSSVEVSVFLHRGYCENGCIFGRDDLLGGKFKHQGDVNSKVADGFANYFSSFDALVASHTEKMAKAQAVMLTYEEMVAALKGAGFGKRLTAAMEGRLMAYGEELGQNVYAVYQAATDVLTHFQNGAGNGLSGAAEDRHQKAAEKLLLYRPKKTATA